MSDFIRFTNNEGMVFEFRIAGFQYTDDAEHQYDSNWLMIEGSILHPLGNWTFLDPCMLMPEVIFLADWLEAVGNGTEKKPYFEAMEPELSYDLVSDIAVRTLRVNFSHSARSPWSNRGDKSFIDFPVEGMDLKLASASLREQLKLINSIEQRIVETMKPFDEWSVFLVE